jgi:hypothetical protein
MMGAKFSGFHTSNEKDLTTKNKKSVISGAVENEGS